MVVDLELSARTDPDSTVRGAALVALGDLRGEAPSELLAELERHDDSEAVRRLAAHALRAGPVRER